MITRRRTSILFALAALLLTGCGQLLAIAEQISGSDDDDDDGPRSRSPSTSTSPTDPLGTYGSDAGSSGGDPFAVDAASADGSAGGRRCGINQPFSEPIEIDTSNLSSLKSVRFGSSGFGIAAYRGGGGGGGGGGGDSIDLHFVQVTGYQLKAIGDFLGNRINEAQSDEMNPTLSTDGKVLVFDRDGDLFVARRGTTGTNGTSPFDLPTRIDIPDFFEGDSAHDAYLIGSSKLYYMRRGDFNQGSDIWVGTLDAERGRLSQTSKLPVVSTNQDNEEHPVVAADDLEIFYTSEGRLFHATRSSITESYRSVARVSSPLSSGSSNGDEYPTWISSDGCELYLMSQRNGGSSALFRARRM